MGSRGGETYDDSSVESISIYAQLLIGKTLAEASNLPKSALAAKGKGGLGNLVESAFFDLPASNKSIPDFPRAGLELKTTGLIWRTVNKQKVLTAKERLSLTMIDFNEIVNETWETSRLLQKCKLMLILTYLYDQEKSIEDRVFLDIQKLLNLLNSTELDTAQFKLDWETIQEKVRQKKAHEISSSDTYYLEATTKGEGKGKERSQPFTDIPAKPRAFAIKQSYLNYLLSKGSNSNVLLSPKVLSIEVGTLKRFEKYFGRSLDQLKLEFDAMGSTNTNKAFHRNLVVKILSNGGSGVPELDKADIELKVVRLNRKGKMREDLSFPNFTYEGIAAEAEWEDSRFFSKLDKKFLFVVFQEDETGSEYLKKAGYWTMPFADRFEAEKVWLDTKTKTLNDIYSFTKMSENPVAHVRPKGPNGSATYPTLFGGKAKRYCFWLNRSYLQKVIDSL